jgi:hypothetical protein
MRHGIRVGGFLAAHAMTMTLRPWPAPHGKSKPIEKLVTPFGQPLFPDLEHWRRPQVVHRARWTGIGIAFGVHA